MKTLRQAQGDKDALSRWEGVVPAQQRHSLDDSPTSLYIPSEKLTDPLGVAYKKPPEIIPP